MSPYEQIEAKYAEHPQERSFDWYVKHYARHGFVFITPTYFIMGRPVNRWAPEDLITEPTYLFEGADCCNCWFVHAMAGNIGDSFLKMPWPLEWIAFERIRGGQKELQILPSARIKRLCLSVPASDRCTI